MRRLSIVSGGLIFVAVVLLIPGNVHAANCYSSTGGDGSDWLCTTVTAGGQPAADVQCYLSAKQWQSGYSYAYESACTDANGVCCFQRETNPSVNCYSTYWWSGSSTTYCNWRSAHCSQYCQENDTSAYYGNYTFATEGYILKATPSWGSSLSEYYAQTDSDPFDVDFDGYQELQVGLTERDEIIRVRVQDGAGGIVGSGSNLSVYFSGPSYCSKELNASFVDCYVSPGDYYVGAYNTNYQNSLYACVTSQRVTVDDGDGVKNVTLTAKRNNSGVEGILVGSDGAPLSGGYVSVGNYSAGTDSCYAYGWAQTGSDGAFSINLPAGTYRMWCSPPWNGSSSSYASKEESVTLASGETLSHNCVLTAKGSSISGAVRDSAGNDLSGAWFSCWTYEDGVHDWLGGSTDTSGFFSGAALDGKRYNCQSYYWNSSFNWNDQTVSQCSDEGMVTVQAPAANVAFTHSLLDHTVNFTLGDSSGGSVSDFFGGGSIRTEDSSGYYSCGYWVSFQGGSNATRLPSERDFCLELYSWGNTSYDPAGERTCFTTGAAGASSSVNVELIPLDATISGSFKDADGVPVTPETAYLSVYCTRGNLWRSCRTDGSEYSCGVSAGEWCCGYWLDWGSEYASVSPGSRSYCTEVASGGQVTQDFTLLKTATISVTVKDNEGNPLRWAWVEVNARSASEVEGDSEEEWEHMYWGNGCMSDSDGKATCTVGASCKGQGTTYYLTARRPWSELSNDNLTLPAEVAVTVKCGETATAEDLIFRRLDGTLDITAVASSEASGAGALALGMSLKPVINSDVSLETDICSGAFISCFSESGGYAEATTDGDCRSTVKCTGGDLWHCFGVNQLDNNLYISESADAACVSDAAVAVNVKLNAAGTIPDAVTQTWDAGMASSFELSDGFSLGIPANAAGESGETVTGTVQPDPILPYQAGKRPAAKYGYDITIRDSSGNPVTQFSGSLTLCLPMNGEQLALLALEASDLQLVYRDAATDAYISLNNLTVDGRNKKICGQTDHLTEFALIGNGNIKAADGDAESASEEAERTEETESGEATDEEGTGGSVAAGGCGGCYMLGDHQGLSLDDRLLWLALILLFAWFRRRSRPTSLSPLERSGGPQSRAKGRPSR